MVSVVRQAKRLPAVASEESLRAFFERGGFAAQVRQNFAGEMERTGDQDRPWLLKCKHQRVANG